MKDPLSAKREEVKNPLETKNPLEIRNTAGSSNNGVKSRTIEFKEEKKQENSEWNDIRLEFVKIFDMKNQNMDSLLQNVYNFFFFFFADIFFILFMEKIEFFN